jgi:excisionase family DNA binding protein
MKLNTLMTIDEVTEVLKISKGTLAVWRCTGRYQLPYIKIGRRVMYDKQDIDQFAP